MTAQTDRYGVQVALNSDIDYFSLARLADRGLGDVSRLPMTVKILLENVLRHGGQSWIEDGDAEALAIGSGDFCEENDRFGHCDFFGMGLEQ